MARTVSLRGKPRSSARGRLNSLFGAINSSYNELIKRGRDQDAFRLRDATRKFAAAGSKFGVNQFARTQALNDLKGEMQAASAVVESRATADKLRAMAGVADQVARVDQMEFQQGMAEQKFDEDVKRNLFAEGLATDRLALDKDRLAASVGQAGAELNFRREQMRAQERAAALARRRQKLASGRVSSPIQSRAQLDPRVVQARQNIIEAEQQRNFASAGGFLTTPAGVTGRGVANPRDVAIAGATMRGGGGFGSRGRVSSPVQSPVAGTLSAYNPLTLRQRIQNRQMSLANRANAISSGGSPVGLTPLR